MQEQLQRRQAAALRETRKGQEEEEEDRGLEGGLLARVKESGDSPSYAVDKSKRKVGGNPDNQAKTKFEIYHDFKVLESMIGSKKQSNKILALHYIDAV